MSEQKPSIPVSCLSTEALGSEAGFELWQESVADWFHCAIDDEASPESFRIRVEAYDLGQMVVAYSESSPQRFHRGKGSGPSHSRDHVLIQAYRTAGFRGEYAHGPIDVEPGDINLLDMMYGLETHTKGRDFACYTLVLPRPLLLACLGTSVTTRRYAVLSRRATPVRLLRHYIVGLFETLPTTAPHEIPGVIDGLLGVLSGTLNGYQQQDGDVSELFDSPALDLIKHFIDCHLQNPELGPEMIGTEFRCSRSYLYRLFRAEGGIKGYIRARRLDRCWSALVCPGHSARSISEVAYQWGFNNHSHFSRMFRERFGMSPRELVGGSHVRVSTGDGTASRTRPPPAVSFSPNAIRADGRLPAYRQWILSLK